MAIVYSNNVVEIAVVTGYQTKEMVNVWHMRDDDFIAQQAIEDLVRDFANAWQDHMMDILHSEATIVRFEYRSLDTNDSTVGVLEPDPAKALVGSQTGTPMSPNVAYLVHKNTSNRPRGRRDGRSYITAVDEANVLGSGQIAPVTLTGYNTFLESFYDSISDTGAWNTTEHYPVVLETTPASRAPGTNPVTIGSRRVTSITMDPFVATQRERLR